jgi:hypothetical protein
VAAGPAAGVSLRSYIVPARPAYNVSYDAGSGTESPNSAVNSEQESRVAAFFMVFLWDIITCVCVFCW